MKDLHVAVCVVKKQQFVSWSSENVCSTRTGYSQHGCPSASSSNPLQSCRGFYIPRISAQRRQPNNSPGRVTCWPGEFTCRVLLRYHTVRGKSVTA